MVSRQSSDGLESPAQDLNHRITTSQQDHHRHRHCHQHHHHQHRDQGHDLHFRITTTHQSNLNQGCSARRKYSMKWDKFWKGKYLIKMGNNIYENLNSNISMAAGNCGLCSSSPNPSPSTQRRQSRVVLGLGPGPKLHKLPTIDWLRWSTQKNHTMLTRR